MVKIPFRKSWTIDDRHRQGCDQRQRWWWSPLEFAVRFCAWWISWPKCISHYFTFNIIHLSTHSRTLWLESNANKSIPRHTHTAITILTIAYTHIQTYTNAHMHTDTNRLNTETTMTTAWHRRRRRHQCKHTIIYIFKTQNLIVFVESSSFSSSFLVWPIRPRWYSRQSVVVITYLCLLTHYIYCALRKIQGKRAIPKRNDSISVALLFMRCCSHRWLSVSVAPTTGWLVDW